MAKELQIYGSESGLWLELPGCHNNPEPSRAQIPALDHRSFMKGLWWPKGLPSEGLGDGGKGHRKVHICSYWKISAASWRGRMLLLVSARLSLSPLFSLNSAIRSFRILGLGKWPIRISGPHRISSTTGYHATWYRAWEGELFKNANRYFPSPHRLSRIWLQTRRRELQVIHCAESRSWTGSDSFGSTGRQLLCFARRCSGRWSCRTQPSRSCLCVRRRCVWWIGSIVARIMQLTYSASPMRGYA